MSDWLVCYHGICLYDEKSLTRIKSDPPRCVKHGAILDWAPDLHGLSREDAKEKLNETRR